MSRRSSVRAQARRIYRDSTPANAAATPDPSPPLPDARGAGAPDLTARVRALYEGSAVPVREIAALAGVAERTIYKYAARHHWKPRYRWAPDRTCRSWRAGAAFAPVKGAGSRFIRRDDKEKPFATGLKATDPAGAARAQAACGEAAQLAEQAQRQAEAAQRQAQQAQHAEATIRAIEWTSRALRQLNDYLGARDKDGNLKRDPERDRQRDLRQYPGAGRYRPRPDRVELVLTQAVNAALSRWEALQKEEAAITAAALSENPAMDHARRS